MCVDSVLILVVHLIRRRELIQRVYGCSGGLKGNKKVNLRASSLFSLGRNQIETADRD